MDRMRSTQLGKMVKQRRVGLGMTLCELADKSGVSGSHLGRIERGERFPSARALGLIAETAKKFFPESFPAPVGPQHPAVARSTMMTTHTTRAVIMTAHPTTTVPTP